jgi:hypothetical protein
MDAVPPSALEPAPGPENDVLAAEMAELDEALAQAFAAKQAAGSNR